MLYLLVHIKTINCLFSLVLILLAINLILEAFCQYLQLLVSDHILQGFPSHSASKDLVASVCEVFIFQLSLALGLPIIRKKRRENQTFF